jgi:hypothetical protein
LFESSPIRYDRRFRERLTVIPCGMRFSLLRRPYEGDLV